MKVIRGVKNIRRRFKKPVVTIGVFDGVHLGHKEVISGLVKRARCIKGTSVVVTFDPHPAKILYPKKTLPLLMSPEHRIKLIEELGGDALILLKFTRSFSKLSAENFVKCILVKKIGAREILLGKDFVFGRNKLGKRSFLKMAGEKSGFKVIEIPMARHSGALISSSRIRRLITEGKIDLASKLLDRPVSILGTVKKGVKRGGLLGYPTANIDPHHEAIPPSGVYAVLARYKGKTYGGILNIGNRPTFYKYSEPTIEVHMFNFKESIYDEDLQIEFVKKVRDEKRFPGKDALIDRIRLDEEKSREILSMI